MLARQGRYPEAEPHLIRVASLNLQAQSWLDLGDVYWATQHRALARIAYGRYLHLLSSPSRLRPGEHPPAPERRATERAVP